MAEIYEYIFVGRVHSASSFVFNSFVMVDAFVRLGMGWLLSTEYQ